jgi:outer membrane protein
MRNPFAPLCGALLLAALMLSAAEAMPAAEAETPLTLEAAIADALATNEIPAIAAARFARAQALRRQAVAALVPRLTFSSTYTRRAQEVTREIDGDEVTVQAIDALNGNLLAQATLFDLRALPLLEAANFGVDAQALESSELERALAHDTATGFLLVLGAERLRDAARQRVEVATQTSEEALLRVEAGLAGRNDATRAALELATARLEETSAANDVLLFRQSLGFLTGSAVGARPLVEPAETALPEGSRDELAAQARATRADLAALAARAEQARQFARAPRLGFVPRLDARGLYTGTNEAGLSGREEDWNAAVTLTWEIFDGGSRSALAAQREAEAEEIALTLAQSRRGSDLEVDQAATRLATADAGLVQAAARLAAARDNAFEVRERYSYGLATALEQADAAVELFEAETEVVRQRYTRSLARLALARALGLWPDGTDSAPDETAAQAASPSSTAAEVALP